MRQKTLRSRDLLVLPMVSFILIPIAALFLRLSPGELWAALQLEIAQKAILLSLFTSVCSVAITILFGTPMAYQLARQHHPLNRMFDTLMDLPVVLPPAVAGVALLMAFGRRSLLGIWLGELGLNIPFTTTAVILAQTFVSAPLYIKTAAAGFAAADYELQRAAALDGASRWQVFRYIIVPMSATSLISGSVMAWARALGEFGATIIFAGNFPGRTQTMPLAIYIGFEIDLRIAIALSVILVGMSFLVLMVVKIILADR